MIKHSNGIHHAIYYHINDWIIKIKIKQIHKLMYLYKNINNIFSKLLGTLEFIQAMKNIICNLLRIDSKSNFKILNNNLGMYFYNTLRITFVFVSLV